MSVANAWASAHALSMVMWSNHQIVVDLHLAMDMDMLEIFVLYKIPILSDVLMLHIQFSCIVILSCSCMSSTHFTITRLKLITLNRLVSQWIISSYCVNIWIQMSWVRFIICSITLLSNRFPITPHSDVARFLKSCHFFRICLWICTLTKFGLG